MAPWQLTTVLRRLGLFAGRASAAGSVSGAPGAVPEASSVPWEPVPLPDPVAVLGPVWDRLAPRTRDAVRDPVRLLVGAGRQTDATTCGSAVLVMLAAAGDPVLALWLAAGLLPDDAGPAADRRPPELAHAPVARLTALADAPVRARFAVLQRVLKHRTNTGALLGLPWPATLGTPPWGAARVARFGGLRFGHRVIDDTDPVHLAGVLRDVDAALARGVPVPLYTGGDTGQGWATAVPRHVVLAIPDLHADGVLAVWEPSVGRVLAISRGDLAAGAPRPAFGGWSHLAWAVLPKS